MESVDKRIKVLSDKIDALHQVVEQLDLKTTAFLAKAAPASEPTMDAHGTPGLTYGASGRSSLERAINHKDVLADEAPLEAGYQNGGKPLAPEVQIQRLTAQLTAAYNRIANLEEHLLAQRIH